ncbi:MAG: translation initiation factor IF-2 [Hormoscilla sp. GM102CHS1]|nr:translation initiation factor IF-2 [Hormoscilla sp. GM102CHS1]
MNNGKVRIYDLSKELDSENKNILKVCEKLNITVKSHSSTISASDAERIRAHAEKHPEELVSHSSQSASVSSASIDTESAPDQPHCVKKRQEILEILPNSKPMYANGSHNQSGATKPQKLRAPKKPVHQHPSQSSELSAANVELPSPPKPRTKGGAAESIGRNEEKSPASEQTLELTVDRQVEEKPELIGPPVKRQEIKTENRPAISVIGEGSEKPKGRRNREENKQQYRKEQDHKKFNQSKEIAEEEGKNIPKSSSEQKGKGVENAETIVSNRPIIKRSKNKEKKQDTSEKQSASKNCTEPHKPPLKRVESQKIVRLASREGSKSRSGLRDEASSTGTQPVLELRRPRPMRPTTAPTDRSDEELSSSLVLGKDVYDSSEADENTKYRELKRPVPRPPKRVKKRESEKEEDEQIESKKVPKAPAKAKRRPIIILDSDLDSDLNSDLDSDDDLLAPVEVSLSLVRPAKPKGSATHQSKLAASAARPSHKGKEGIKSQKTSARNHREQASKEKPSKIVLKGGLTVQELASLLVVPSPEIVKGLFYKGIAATVTQTLDVETASLVAQELGVEVEMASAESEARKVTEMLDEADLENLQRRPPVVTIMGHVDHGKTTLLDSIRKTKVAQGEAGGITQHIGAYHVDVEHGGSQAQIVFLDTPGHEAFTAMRARGARITDIAILVVAADDGVRPQTIEAISHAQAAEVPLVVAINKIDKEGAQPDRVKQELMDHRLVPEEWGGETIMVPVSASEGENLDTLLEMILLVAEIEELSANPDRVAKGTVIEAHLDKAKGPVATLLVQNGTLRVGDTLLAGAAIGKIRAMIDDRGQRVETAGPSCAVEVLGLGDVPSAGDEFLVFADEKEAKAIAQARILEQQESRWQQAMASRRVTLNSLSARAQEGELKELNLVLKADVQGSVEAILGSLKQLPQNEVQVRVLLAAPGEIAQTDVDLAAASDAVIVGFNTNFASGARAAADDAGVDVREYDVIYSLLDDIQGAMEGLLDPEMVEEELGSVEVRAVFNVGKGVVAGCYVLSGKAVRNCNLRVYRGKNVIYEGILDSLKRMKDDVKEVSAGFECGIGVDKFNDWAENDIIKTYRMVTKRRTLSTK